MYAETCLYSCVYKIYISGKNSSPLSSEKSDGMARKLAVLSFKFPLVSKIEKMERGRRYRDGPGAGDTGVVQGQEIQGWSRGRIYGGGPGAGDTGVVQGQEIHGWSRGRRYRGGPGAGYTGCAAEAIFCCPTENSHHLKS